MHMALKSVFFMVTLLALSSCGKKINAPIGGTYESDAYSYLLLERQCSSDQVVEEPVTKEIGLTYYDFQMRFPVAFFNMPERLYDYKTPLIINMDELSEKLTLLKKKIANTQYLEANVKDISVELYYLFQHSMRYEGQKCQLANLSRKKLNDNRPYLEIREYCQENDCSSESIDDLTGERASFIGERVVKMCRSFDPSRVNCQSQYNIQSKNRKVSTLLKHYQKRFEKERYDKLFVLRESHLKFQCTQSSDETTTMSLKVYSKGWDTEKLKAMLSHVSETWSRGSFKFSIEIVEERGSDVIEIFPITGGISYVPDNDTRQVYLSQSLDPNTQKKVLAHEFGHVLGFPDCYTEFFDSQKSDLVYYEISAEDTNLMCSLKNGARVPDSYLKELREKSCVFN